MERELSRLADGRLLDCAPMRAGNLPLVFDAGKWAELDCTLEDVGNSRPLNKSAIAALPAWILEADGKAPETMIERTPKLSSEKISEIFKNNPRLKDMTMNPDAPKSFILGM